MSEIGRKVREIEKERRAYMQEVMLEYDKVYHARLKELRDSCEHNFHFTHFGPVGHPWYCCTICGRSKVGVLD